MKLRRTPAAALLSLALVAACDSGPRGPGTLVATVDADGTLGAVTLEVVGPGVLGFEGVGDTQAYGTTVSASQNRHRVVLVGPGMNPTLEVAIEVEDVGAEPPTLRVVGAAGTDNLERLTGGIEVRVGGG